MGERREEGVRRFRPRRDGLTGELMAVNERIRREVELLPWPEVIGVEEDVHPSWQLVERAGEIAVERDELLRCGEVLAGEVKFWKRQAGAWRRLAIMAGLVLVGAGAWRLLG